MSSTIPDDSASPGSVLPDTDASSGEENLPLLHDVENDDNRNLSPDNEPAMEEAPLLSTVPEADKVAPASDVQASDTVQESKDELEQSDPLEAESQSSDSNLEANDEETEKLNPSPIRMSVRRRQRANLQTAI